MTVKLSTLVNQFIKKTDKIPSNFTGIVEWTDGQKEWCVDGKLHRLDGPAYVGSDGTKYWYVDGKQVVEEQCKLLHSIMKLKGLM